MGHSHIPRWDASSFDVEKRNLYIQMPCVAPDCHSSFRLHYHIHEVAPADGELVGNATDPRIDGDAWEDLLMDSKVELLDVHAGPQTRYDSDDPAQQHQFQTDIDGVTYDVTLARRDFDVLDI